MFVEGGVLKTNTARELRNEADFAGILGHSAIMQGVFTLLRQVMPTDVRVLISGESGTGKECIARAIHDGGSRQDGPFVAVDCGGAIAVCVLGIFGVVWVRKQQERYHYWQSIALQYQEELIKIVPLLKSRDAYEKHAESVAAEEVGPILARRIYERHLWVTLHVIVVILGLELFLISMKE